jgi:hypothetical protein
MTIKGIRIFRSKSFQNVTKLGLWFETNHLATLIVTRVQLSFTIEVFADSVFDFESERGNAKIKILFFFSLAAKLQNLASGEIVYKQ